MSSGPKLKFLPDILEEHIEEFGFLWSQRRTALRSPIYTRRAFRQLEGRITAHLEGILVVGDGAYPRLEEALRSDDPWELFAGAFALMRAGSERGVQFVGEAFFGAEGERLDALVDVLSYAPLGSFERRLAEEVVAASPRPVTAAAAEALSLRGRLNLNMEQFDRLLRNQNAEIRRRGWRAAGLHPVARRPETYQAGIADPDPAVRREALIAAAWARQEWLIEHFRRLSTQLVPENRDAILLLAVLGKTIDVARITPVAQAGALGRSRFQALGAIGHPSVVELLLKHIEGKDPAAAAGAAAAFVKITGKDVGSGTRAQLPPEDGHAPDDFEKEFLEEVMLPDPQAARSHWSKVQAQFARGTRWARGCDVSAVVSDDVLVQLDQESRWQACLRGRFEGAWRGNPVDLEVFPQP